MTKSLSMVGLLLLTLTIGCTQSESDSLVTAVRSYRVASVSIDRVLTQKAETLQKKGVDSTPVWISKKLDEDSYEIVARLAASDSATKNDSSFSWIVSRNRIKSNQKESVWQIEPASAPAKKLMAMDAVKLQQWQQTP